MHCYLLNKCTEHEDPTNNIVYGPSTQKVEGWWRELHHRMELYFKEQLHQLLESGSYDPENEVDRKLLSFVFIPVIQKEFDIFRQTVWNNHRGRKNRNKDLPCGIPEHIYLYPEQYVGQNVSY
ncbi:hypothetical protein LOTGIDRAFT_171423 [Lottia gigantea]|uniref:Integrase core domain-containing protein n=1 Tax=Lottia gigantea TaxID=225164 RepID=V4B7D5_LOTGI|nr:hypothetical protein LOTGIDRAFT_171423 [Lottia gigantea]ESP03486.1 hypothetical protein LOTGIDRAFT_171423 [Lottia gigantea]